MNYYKIGFIAGLEKTAEEKAWYDINTLPYWLTRLGGWGLTKLPNIAANRLGSVVGGVLGGPVGWGVGAYDAARLAYDVGSWGYGKYQRGKRQDILRNLTSGSNVPIQGNKPRKQYSTNPADYGITQGGTTNTSQYNKPQKQYSTNPADYGIT